MIRERWALLLAGAVTSVIGDIILAILAASPKGLYLLPWVVVGSAMVAVKVGTDFYEERLTAKTGRPRGHQRARPGSADIIRGDRQGSGDPEDAEAYLFAGTVCGALFIIAGLIVIFVVGSALGWEIGLPLLLDGCFVFALGFRFGLGLRAYLAISADGVVFKGKRIRGQDRRDRLTIGWNEVTDFLTTESPGHGGPWLAAIPLPGSPLIFRGPASKFYEPKHNLILICNLPLAGIKEHVVNGALHHWRPK